VGGVKPIIFYTLSNISNVSRRYESTSSPVLPAVELSYSVGGHGPT